MLLVPSLFPSSRGLEAAINQLFDAPFADAARAPALDVERTDNGYTVVLDVPGVAKEDVKVTIDGKRVSVEAESMSQAASEGKRLIYRERTSRRFARSFTLPEPVDQTASSAKLENGVLTLTLQRLASGAQAITVN